jgi:predicted HTH transcriptional regulator
MNELPWEDGLLERKLESDQKDFLKTFVAFANSVRPDHTAIVLIGERDDGSVQGVTDPDEMQKKVRRECERIFPDIVWRAAVYVKDSKPCVKVEIEYSGDTPHFGEAAWIRRGSGDGESER